MASVWGYIFDILVIAEINGADAENYILIFFKSNQILIVITFSRLIWHQTIQITIEILELQSKFCSV